MLLDWPKKISVIKKKEPLYLIQFLKLAQNMKQMKMFWIKLQCYLLKCYR